MTKACLALFLLGHAVAPATAEERGILVELFTSAGLLFMSAGRRHL